MGTINGILAGKHSNAVIQFFCGEYFNKTITAHPKFEELKKLFWEMEKKQYNRYSKKKKAIVSLNLTDYTSGFFSNPNIENNPKVIKLQREILGDWAIYDSYWGVSINWHNVFKSAYESGCVVKTDEDFANVVNLQDIPQY